MKMHDVFKFIFSLFAAESVVGFALLFLDPYKVQVWWTGISHRPLEHFPINFWALYENVDGKIDLFWPTYYGILGLSLFVAWRQEEKYPSAFQKGLIFWVIYIVIAGLWSYVYAELQSIVIVIPIVMFACIMTALSAKYFYKVSRAAAFLLIPSIFFTLLSAYLYTHLLVINPYLL